MRSARLPFCSFMFHRDRVNRYGPPQTTSAASLFRPLRTPLSPGDTRFSIALPACGSGFCGLGSPLNKLAATYHANITALANLIAQLRPPRPPKQPLLTDVRRE